MEAWLSLLITLFPSIVFVLHLEKGLLGLDCQNIFFVKSPQVLPPVFVGIVYRPPHELFVRGTKFIPDIVDNMHKYSSKMGDFNSEPQSDQADADFICNFVKENSLISIPFGAIYHKENVDEQNLCMADTNVVVHEYLKSEAPFTDGNDMITVTIASSLTPLPFRDFTNRDFEDVDEKYSAIIWLHVTGQCLTVPALLRLTMTVSITISIKQFKGPYRLERS